MPHPMLASVVASVTEFKKDPQATVEAGCGEIVAILNHDEPAFYCIPAARYEELLDYIDDLELAMEVKERLKASEPAVSARIVGGDVVFEDDGG
ncbi:type II toxin-antitoxin system Phd/YefM family antitoxin [Azotobacter salinestris]|uniref:type II toxin-antitoxin system Phd/YefM family antitoxin n=1 Tax=Azotobacter salinestris TaxID=69964 RepID=UPI0032DF454B